MKTTHLLFIVGILLILQACQSGTESRANWAKGYNYLTIEPALADHYDYLVKLQNIRDIGYDPDDPATRQKVAKNAMDPSCKDPQIVGEDNIKTGVSRGRQNLTYLIEMKCS